MLHPVQTGFRKRVPVILQTEAAECGLACLAMILNVHGHLIDLATLRRETAVSSSGLNLHSLIRIADRYGLSARPVRLELTELTKLQIPCILHWNFSHFVVMVRAEENSVIINDPAHGRKKLSLDEVSKHFTGIALELTPAARFEKRDDRTLLNVRDMFRHVTRLKTSLLVIGALSLGLEIIALINPMLSQVIIDEVLTTGDHPLLWTIAIGLALLVILQGTISTFRTWTIMLFSTRLSLQWNVSLFTHLIRLPQDYFAKRGAGDILSRFGSLGTIQRTFTTDLIQSIMDGLMAIGMFAMIIIYGHWLAGIVIISSFADILIRVVLFRPYREMSEEVLVHDAARQGHFLETLRGIRSIKLLALEEKRRIAWLNRLIDSVNAGLKIQRYDLIFARTNDIIFATDRILMLILGANMVLAGKMSVGMLMAFLSYRDQFAGRLGSLIGAGFKIRNLNVQCDRLSDIALAEAETTDRKSLPSPLQSIWPVTPVLECRNLSYRYGKEDAWIFRNLNLTVKNGQSVAITGPSGCGKSTLLSIMMGLATPEEGKILWNGIDLTPQNREHFHCQIAGVLQEDSLLSGSLTENIACFDENMDMAWVLECARNAQILEEILHMPMGMETLVGEMGSTLSGGQKQRIILARALYRRPSILFLDEATSHLDGEREEKITAFLDHMQITRIIVAHRLETIKRADLRFDMGQPVYA